MFFFNVVRIYFGSVGFFYQLHFDIFSQISLKYIFMKAFKCIYFQHFEIDCYHTLKLNNAGNFDIAALFI